MTADRADQSAGGDGFQAAELEDVAASARAAADGYAGNVLHSSLLSVGVYILAAGAKDSQKPHAEDEVYYTVSGRAVIRVEEEDHPVQPGSLLFVPARAAHQFHDIADELVLVVFWAPPEGTGAANSKTEALDPRS